MATHTEMKIKMIAMFHTDTLNLHAVAPVSTQPANVAEANSSLFWMLSVIVAVPLAASSVSVALNIYNKFGYKYKIIYKGNACLK